MDHQLPNEVVEGRPNAEEEISNHNAEFQRGFRLDADSLNEQTEFFTSLWRDTALANFNQGEYPHYIIEMLLRPN